MPSHGRCTSVVVYPATLQCGTGWHVRRTASDPHLAPCQCLKHVFEGALPSPPALDAALQQQPQQRATVHVALGRRLVRLQVRLWRNGQGGAWPLGVCLLGDGAGQVELLVGR